MPMPGQKPLLSYINSDRQRLFYAEWENDGAPTVILLHGGLDHSRSWDPVATRLAQRYRVIAPDLRGHGHSDWTSDGRYPMAGFVYDLAELISQLSLENVMIVAHSLGGNIALRYTGLYPDNVRALVAIEGLGPSPDFLAKLAAEDPADRRRREIDRRRALITASRRRYPSLDAAEARMRKVHPFLTAELARHLVQFGTHRHEDGTYTWKFDPLANLMPYTEGQQAEVNILFGRITCPTLLLYGADSFASNPEEDGRIRLFGDNARVVLFEGAGHWLQHQKFDAFMATIGPFLDAAAPTTPA